MILCFDDVVETWHLQTGGARVSSSPPITRNQLPFCGAMKRERERMNEIESFYIAEVVGG